MHDGSVSPGRQGASTQGLVWSEPEGETESIHRCLRGLRGQSGSGSSGLQDALGTPRAKGPHKKAVVSLGERGEKPVEWLPAEERLGEGVGITSSGNALRIDGNEVCSGRGCIPRL